MATASDLIAALDQRRLLRRGSNTEPGTYPPAWQQWFDALPALDPTPGRARAAKWMDVFARRNPADASRSGFGRPFFRMRALERPHDPRQERGVRIGVAAVDVVLHIVLAALLLWLMYLHFAAVRPADDDDGGEAIQVQFIGRGNAVEGGGAIANAGEGAPAQGAASRAREAAATAVPAKPASSAVAAASTAAEPAASAAAPDPQPAAAAEAAQPLQVTEARQSGTPVFALPPPREAPLRLPQPELRDVRPQQAVQEIATVQPRGVQVLKTPERQPTLRLPEPARQAQALEVFVPDAPPSRNLPAAPVVAAQPDVPALRAQVREVPIKAAEAGTAATGNPSSALADSGSAGASVRGDGQAQAGVGAGNRAGDAGGRGVAASGQGAGPGARPAVGGWPGQAKSDDWGSAARNAAGTAGAGQGSAGGSGNAGAGGAGRGTGAKPGLFNDDGSARLGDAWSKGSGVDIDREGTWLKRPGLEYRGTRFDRYWIPQGNLLQEWVRKGVRRMSIPIPGSNARLECVISLLQLGGGCVPVDPDVNEQSATGRPPPDVPFKPELQEDNGSVRPGG